MRIVAFGEGMDEFRRCGDGWSQSLGGDVLNTVIHLRRFGHDVAFASAIGPNQFSRQLRCAWEGGGLDLSLLAIDPERQCGTFFIGTDAKGERSFIYWSDQSAAKRMVHLLDGRLSVRMAEAELVYLSLITVAILPDEDREILLKLLEQARRSGAKIAFDNNYRPMLWRDGKTARHGRAQFCAIADFGLPTLDDEEMLGAGASADAVQAEWAALGCREVVVKTGKQGCVLHDRQSLAPDGLVQVVDTSGAGDSFNAAYLSSKHADQPRLLAGRPGNRLASWVIGQRGAIPPEKAGMYRSVPHETG